jgi:hypothetical protein
MKFCKNKKMRTICQDEDMNEVKEEENKEDMVPYKLVGVWEPPLSPSTYDSNPETKNSNVMHDFVVLNNGVDASEEYFLEIIYGNALNDGLMILDVLHI